MSQAAAQTDDGWSRQVHALAGEAGISLVATVPDAGLTQLLRLCSDDDRFRVVTLSTEEEGVGMAYGAWLGGTRSLLCLQSSGTGNCINALALPAFTRSPCLMLVTMRGQEGEGNPAQFPMGRAVRAVFEAMGVVVMEAMTKEEVPVLFGQAADLAFGEGKACAVLVAQQVIGVKDFAK
ncbi:MAG TPA: phosphonopyruvate decarboxylase [Rhizobiales bacterium]|nr:phosphonopyruvate decarboxylase [Hyphomicrobiales bacterium]